MGYKTEIMLLETDFIVCALRQASKPVGSAVPPYTGRHRGQHVGSCKWLLRNQGARHSIRWGRRKWKRGKVFLALIRKDDSPLVLSCLFVDQQDIPPV